MRGKKQQNNIAIIYSFQSESKKKNAHTRNTITDWLIHEITCSTSWSFNFIIRDIKIYVCWDYWRVNKSTLTSENNTRFIYDHTHTEFLLYSQFPVTLSLSLSLQRALYHFRLILELIKTCTVQLFFRLAFYSIQ